jgi:SulP family sulfate permease
VVTVFTDLAIAVVLGVVISALAFAWQHAKQISVKSYTNEMGWKVYELEGTLFFASVAGFQNLFTPAQDSDEVIIEFLNARVVDHSAIEAIDALAARYLQLGKRLHLRHLSHDSLELLDKAKKLVEINITEDPHYHIAASKLG